MKKPAIEVKNLSKSYIINHRDRASYSTIKDDFSKLLKKPFRKSERGDEKFWALKDVSFEIQPGEIYGVIGKNGSGKSTLLKILSRIVQPTHGEVIMRGRVASLLEVGTGFHPELTGRENIFFNGSMLGMSKKEIESKFDEIVAFSEVEKFIDTPVKFYSSGMYVRLAFSVAAHLDPDILILDEVLAVGDSSFQKKSMKKIQSIMKDNGTTVLFVSHSMNVVRQICDKAILLDKGIVKSIGNTDAVSDLYMNENFESAEGKSDQIGGARGSRIKKVAVTDDRGKTKNLIDMNTAWGINLEYEITENLKNTIIAVEILDIEGNDVYMTCNSDDRKELLELKKGSYSVHIDMSEIRLAPGTYYLRVTIQTPGVEVNSIKESVQINISAPQDDIRLQYFNGKFIGLIATKAKWQTINTEEAQNIKEQKNEFSQKRN